MATVLTLKAMGEEIGGDIGGCCWEDLGGDLGKREGAEATTVRVEEERWRLVAIEN